MVKMILFNLTLVFLFVGIEACGHARAENLSTNEESSLSNPPRVAQLFQPGIISRFDRWSFTPTFSKDMKTLVFVSWKNALPPSGPNTLQELNISRFRKGKWTKPEEIKQTQGFRVDWPHFSPDGKKFLLSFTKPHKGQPENSRQIGWDDFDLWQAPANDSGEIDWSAFEPIVGSDINRRKTPSNATIRYVHNETGPKMDLAGNLYFWTERLDQGEGRRDIYSAKSNGKGSWENAEAFAKPINSPFRESGAAVSNDGKWMIFSSERPGGLGKSDLYFSRKLDDGSWSEPKNLGAKVNSASDEGTPELSPDNKSLFFTSNRKIEGKPIQSRGEGSRYNAIYWISV